VHGAVRYVDHRGHQDRRQDVDRRQVLPHQVRHQDRRGVRHRDHQDVDQNQDVLQDHQGRRDVGHQDPDGIHLDHRGVRHQDQDEHQDHQGGRQDQGGSRSDLDEKIREPCADLEVAGCADLSKTRGLEVAESEDDRQADARLVACQEAYPSAAFRGATEHVQRGALGVSWEAD